MWFIGIYPTICIYSIVYVVYWNIFHNISIYVSHIVTLAVYVHCNFSSLCGMSMIYPTM